MEANYIAGTLCGEGKERIFGFIHCTEFDIPYLTKNPNGLKSTSDTSALYLLSTDCKRAVKVRDESGFPNPLKVDLTEEQTQAIQKAIRLNYYFD